MGVYSLEDYVKIIKSEYYRGNSISAKRYFKIYKENGGKKEYKDILKKILSPAQRKAKSAKRFNNMFKGW